MQPNPPLYFDNHATTPLDPRVLEAMLPFFKEDFGNAESSQHAYGWKAKSAVDKARKQIADLIGAQRGEIIFTSGATESIHLAILGFLEKQPPASHLITANTEHKATLEVCARAERLGHAVTILPVDRLGQVSAAQVAAALRPNTVLVSLMHGNNEIGTLHPIAEIGALLRERGRARRVSSNGNGGGSDTGGDITFHVDAAQTIGKHAIDVQAMNIDMLSISGHKYYAPKGVGALFARRFPSENGVSLAPFISGGGHERGLRGGTHNVPGIVGLGFASEIAQAELASENSRLTGLRDHLISSVRTAIEGVELNGHPTERLCNNVSFTIRGIPSDIFLTGLRDIAYSSASACSSGSGATSHVLRAIGQTTSDPLVTTMRFGLGRFNTAAQVDTLISRLIATVRMAR
jgi:cysteine desulfurase